MHPPLFKPHPMCQEMVEQLVKCHDENPYGKFLGACNEAKTALDKCFRQEKIARYKANMESAKAMDEKRRQRTAERQALEAAAAGLPDQLPQQ
ncbi:hypothetical protein JKP88DRAFT_25195 [Tribonema minus]|uniref:COX assembly mitochondrial protein n=1 Tax=Tribonema minus TaxID=303371 RepID=A0A835ZCC5_9STRA|nr:hypothetical protein JKP88DRAFT_25195 [Tribonema minus]